MYVCAVKMRRMTPLESQLRFHLSAHPGAAAWRAAAATRVRPRPPAVAAVTCSSCCATSIRRHTRNTNLRVLLCNAHLLTRQKDACTAV